jgi:CheY-like chemotaxis protein
MKPLAGKRVLVVEDEAIIAAMVEDMLTELGAVVVGPAATIAQGLTLARSEAIDGAVLDVNLRSERIDPIAEALRVRGIPFIYATGYGDAVAASAGGVPVIEKPYTMEKLAKAVTGMVEGRT